MTEQGVAFEIVCNNCGAVASGWKGEVVRGGRLTWVYEWDCRSCGLVSDDGGDGMAPPEIRAAIIQKFGVQRISVAEGGTGSVALLKAIRAAYGFTMPQAAAVLKDLRGEGFEATSAEINYLSSVLEGSGTKLVIGSTPAVPGAPHV
ncbi:hypothetical protein [Kitasatospora sp. NPDC057015]|uniref:hypothetical protein n=1 Tax=Kitasatospora sp. NPDC057015 TaxID=3346001 RepID=UPI00363FAF46